MDEQARWHWAYPQELEKTVVCPPGPETLLLQNILCKLLSFVFMYAVSPCFIS